MYVYIYIYIHIYIYTHMSKADGWMAEKLKGQREVERSDG